MAHVNVIETRIACVCDLWKTIVYDLLNKTVTCSFVVCHVSGLSVVLIPNRTKFFCAWIYLDLSGILTSTGNQIFFASFPYPYLAPFSALIQNLNQMHPLFWKTFLSELADFLYRCWLLSCPFCVDYAYPCPADLYQIYHLNRHCHLQKPPPSSIFLCVGLYPYSTSPLLHLSWTCPSFLKTCHPCRRYHLNYHPSLPYPLLRPPTHSRPSVFCLSFLLSFLLSFPPCSPPSCHPCLPLLHHAALPFRLLSQAPCRNHRHYYHLSHYHP